MHLFYKINSLDN